jgi:YVTN family beta-propeller protein
MFNHRIIWTSNWSHKKAGLWFVIGILILIITPVAAASFAYVTDLSGNSVLVIDTNTNTIKETVSMTDVGGGIYDIAIAPDGKHVYTVNSSSWYLSVIDTTYTTSPYNRVFKTVLLGPGSRFVAVAPDGKRVYVPNSSDNTVSVIDTTNYTVSKINNVGNAKGDPAGIVVAPDSKHVYVANVMTSTVSVIDTTKTPSEVSTISLSPQKGAINLAIAPDGKYLYVVNGVSQTMSVIDTMTNTIKETVIGLGTGSVATGTGPQGIAVAPDGKHVYVGNSMPAYGVSVSTLYVIDTTYTMPPYNRVFKTLQVGQGAEFVAVTPDGKSVYVTNPGDRTVSVIDTTNYTVSKINNVGNYPVGIAIQQSTPPPTINLGDVVDTAKRAIGINYQWGAKGYDMSPGNQVFVSDQILSSGYYYWNTDLGKDKGFVKKGPGLDCAGLNMWSFNRTFYGDQFVNWDTCTKGGATKRCPVFFEGADDQWRSNSTKQTGAPSANDLRVGDLLFFNTKNAKAIDGGPVMDHTAMYVGQFEFTQGKIVNVVHAHGWSKTNAVVPAWYDAKSGELITDSFPYDGSNNRLKVTGWGRISDPRIDAWVITHSPVRLVITDPQGQTVDVRNTLSDKNGYTNEIPGMSYMMKDIDSIVEDTVAISELKPGAYFIKVEPKPDVLPVEKFSLEVRFPNLGRDTIWLSKDEPATSRTFVVESTENGIFESLGVILKIKPSDTIPRINPKSKGFIPIAIMGSTAFSVSEILFYTIQLDGDSNRDTQGITLQKSSQEDVNHDGILDLVMHFSTTNMNAAGLLKDLKQIYITGTLRDGSPIIARDTVHLVGGAKY